MKKEELLELGLNEEQIAGVFRLNGIDINELKSENETLKEQNSLLKTEKEQVEEQLVGANEKIEQFSSLDVESIQAEAEKYKQEYEQLKTENEKHINNIQLDFAVEKALIKSGARNAKAVKSLLDMELLKSSNNLSEDLASQIGSIKESDDYLFESEKVTKPVAGSNTLGDEGKKVENMTYSEMVAYLEKNPNAKI